MILAPNARPERDAAAANPDTIIDAPNSFAALVGLAKLDRLRR
jgi:hypothetical protein